jgi:hypothetical protein
MSQYAADEIDVDTGIEIAVEEFDKFIAITQLQSAGRIVITVQR